MGVCMNPMRGSLFECYALDIRLGVGIVTGYVAGEAVDVRLSASSHPLKALGDPVTNGTSGRREQHEYAEDIGNDARRNEHDSGAENHEPVDHVIRGKESLGELLLDARPNGKAFSSRQVRAQHTGDEHDSDGGKCADSLPKLNQQVELYYREDGK